MNFAFVANNPLMREWYGERIRDEVRLYTFTTAMKVYQVLLATKRVDMVYDKLGILQRNITNFFNGKDQEYDRLAFAKWMSATGAGPTGYDAVALFSTAHPHGGSGNQSNFSSGTNLSDSAVRAAEIAGALLTKENGEPMGIVYDTIEVGPKLKRRAQEIFNADRYVGLSSGTAEGGTTVAATTITNVLAGAMNVVVNPRITGFYWTCLDTTKPGTKPLICQENRAPEPVILDQMDSEPRVKYDEFWHIMEGDFDFNAGYWQVAYRGTGSA
jgi:phage major head subunit gpT-like protein